MKPADRNNTSDYFYNHDCHFHIFTAQYSCLLSQFYWLVTREHFYAFIAVIQASCLSSFSHHGSVNINQLTYQNVTCLMSAVVERERVRELVFYMTGPRQILLFLTAFFGFPPSEGFIAALGHTVCITRSAEESEFVCTSTADKQGLISASTESAFPPVYPSYPPPFPPLYHKPLHLHLLTTTGWRKPMKVQKRPLSSTRARRTACFSVSSISRHMSVTSCMALSS